MTTDPLFSLCTNRLFCSPQHKLLLRHTSPLVLLSDAKSSLASVVCTSSTLQSSPLASYRRTPGLKNVKVIPPHCEASVPKADPKQLK